MTYHSCCIWKSTFSTNIILPILGISTIRFCLVLKTFLLGCDIDKVSFCNFHFLWFFVNVNSLSFTFLVFSLSGQEKALKALSVAMPSFSLVAKYKFVFISVQGQQFFRPLFLKLYLHSLINVENSYNEWGSTARNLIARQSFARHFWQEINCSTQNLSTARSGYFFLVQHINRKSQFFTYRNG